MNSRRFKLYRAYSVSFTSSNVGKCFWSWILKDCIKVQEKKRKLLSCVPVVDKTWIQALSRCSRATTAKKCTKKAWCTCKVVVLLIKPIAFLPFSLPSASSLLKLPKAKIRRPRLGKGAVAVAALSLPKPPRVFRISFYRTTFHHYLGAWNRLTKIRSEVPPSIPG